MSDSAALYLDLLKLTLTNFVYGASEVKPIKPKGRFKGLKRRAVKVVNDRGIQMVRRAPMNAKRRSEGKDWPPNADSMIGLKRLDNLQFCVEDVLAKGVPGDLIETGVWRGGATIFMRAVLKAHGVTDRTVWVADSFAGLPPPNAEAYPEDEGDDLYTHAVLAVPLEQVQANFEKYGLLDDQVRFLKGWFRDTLPGAPIETLAVLRLDGDLYESTMDALTSLYPKVSVGGYVIVDDYGAVKGCRQAVADYREAHGIEDEIHEVDWTGAYWQRSAQGRRA